MLHLEQHVIIFLSLYFFPRVDVSICIHSALFSNKIYSDNAFQLLRQTHGMDDQIISIVQILVLSSSTLVAFGNVSEV